MTTNIYLDVDGVLNALSSNPPKQNTGWTGEWKREKAVIPSDAVQIGWSSQPVAESYTMFWSTKLITAINELAEMDDVTIIWLTTWKEHAKGVISPLMGINGHDWLHLDTGDIYDTMRWWKLDAIRDHVEETKPDKVVWLDDDIAYDQKARLWVSMMKPKILSITPNSVHGLTKPHIQSIINFIND